MSPRSKDELDLYYESLVDKFKTSDKASDFAKYFYASLSSGDSKFYQKNITEVKVFDEEWIKTLEAFMPSIDNIIKNPKSSIRYDEQVVAIEKAKKINSASVRHLASHTEYIKEVRPNGMVTPKKILTSFAEEELATYENRMIMTLIDRLYVFIKNRYEIIRDNVESFQKDHMNYENCFHINDSEVMVKVDIVIKKDLDNKVVNQKNHELLKRTEYLMSLVSSFKSSPFMKALAKAKKINPPIMKTNMILKNVDFNNAYMLWLFIDRYSSLGYDVNIKERPIRLSKAFGDDLHRLSIFTYSMVLNNMKNRSADFVNLETVEPIVKKSTKIAKNNPADFVKNPDAIIIEDNTINEFYLQENKKVFNKRVKSLIEEKVSEPAALRKAIKDTLNISDALFDTLFYLEEDEDYYQKMVTENDPNEDYIDAFQKAKFAKAIREAKEANYKKAVKLERSLVKKMDKANRMLIAENAKRKKAAEYEMFKKNIEKDDKNYKKIKERNQKQIDFLDGKLLDIENNKTALQNELDEMNKQIKEGSKTIAATERKKVAAELKQMELEHKNKMAALLEEEKNRLTSARERKKERLASHKKAIKEKLDAFKKKEQDKTKEKLAKEKKKFQDLLKSKKENINLKEKQIDEETTKEINELNKNTK